MIELRYEKRGGEPMFYPGNGQPMGKNYPLYEVLQYRVLWGRWKDVPIVAIDKRNQGT